MGGLRGRLITPNNDIGKELDLEIEFVFSHVERIWCVKFIRDGKYLAA
jgi:phosphoribulokinase